jgi:hypothetical protein
MYTVKPVLRAHIWPYKTGGLLKEVEFIWNLLWQEKKKVTFIYMDVVKGAEYP